MRRKAETERETTTYIVSGVLGIMETQQVKTMACEMNTATVSTVRCIGK